MAFWHQPALGMEDLFEMLDVDGGGTLTQDEFLEGWWLSPCIDIAHLCITALDFLICFARASLILGFSLSLLTVWGGYSSLDQEYGRKGMDPAECGRQGNGGKWRETDGKIGQYDDP